jgi:hypothetical protein
LVRWVSEREQHAGETASIGDARGTGGGTEADQLISLGCPACPEFAVFVAWIERHTKD